MKTLCHILHIYARSTQICCNFLNFHIILAKCICYTCFETILTKQICQKLVKDFTSPIKYYFKFQNSWKQCYFSLRSKNYFLWQIFLQSALRRQTYLMFLFVFQAQSHKFCHIFGIKFYTFSCSRRHILSTFNRSEK